MKILALFAALSVLGLFLRLNLAPEPPTKGFCGFVGPCVACAAVDATGVSP